MADEADQAQAQIEMSIMTAFQNRRRSNLKPIGRCWFCEETLTGALLFCSSECRDDYDRESAAKARAGTR
jgi:hypothetical protein